MATQRVATTARYHHIEKLSRGTYQPPNSPRPTTTEGRGTRAGIGA